MVTIEVKDDVLKWAVQRTGNEEYIYKKFPKLREWINKESQPTLKQLEKLANATSTPLGYFFLSEPPIEELSLPHYRTIGDKKAMPPSTNLLDTIQTMEQRKDWLRDYLIEMGRDPLHFVGSASLNDNPKEIARRIRNELGLAKGWAAIEQTWQNALTMLIKRVEDIGIVVVINGVVGNNTHRKLDVNEFRGFVLVDEYAPFIFVNGADNKAAQMFTIAHELAHIWLGASAVFDLYQLQPSQHKIERICNQVAAEFLVPEKEFLEMWPHFKDTPEKFQSLARHFKVSEIVIARRALDLNMITKQDFFEFYQDHENKLKQKEEQIENNGGNFYATQNYRIGRRFARAVISATKEGRLLYREAYRLTGLHGKTFSEYAARIESEVNP